MFPSKKVQKIVGSRVQVEMKGDAALLEGRLASVDDYMNLYLTDAEVSENETKRAIGNVVLRGNNIILITPLDE